MRIFVNSDEGGKPFELFTHEDALSGAMLASEVKPGWYYMLMQQVETASPQEQLEYEPLEDAPAGPFASLVMAFKDAITCNYDINPNVDIAAGVLYEATKYK